MILPWNTYRRLAILAARIAMVVLLGYYPVTGQPTNFAIPTNSSQAYSKVLCMAQHPDGYLLIGTRVGLMMYNGQSFKKIPINSSIKDSAVTALRVIGPNKTMVGFANGQVALFQNKLFTTLASLPTLHSPITSILNLPDQTIAVATAGKGIFLLQGNTVITVNTRTGLSDDYVYDLENWQGRLVAATDAGINLISTVGSKPTITVIATRQGLADNICTQLVPLTNDQLLVAHDKMLLSVVRLHKNEPTAVHTINTEAFGRIIDMNAYSQGAVAVTARGAVITVSNNGSIQPLESVLPKNMIPQRCFIDNLENLWLATGADLSFAGSAILQKLDGNFPQNTADIAAIASWQHHYAVAANQTIYLNGTAQNFGKPKISLPAHDAKITDMYPQPDGTLWVGTMNHGLWKLSTKTGKSYALPFFQTTERKSILAVSGNNQTIWVSSLAGTFEINNIQNSNNAELTVKPLALTDAIGTNYIYDILQDTKQRLWFASDGEGIIAQKNNEWVRYSRQQGLLNDVVYRIVEDSKGKIWAQVLDGRVFVLNEKLFKQFTADQGLNTLQPIGLFAAKNLAITSQTAIDFIDPENYQVANWYCTDPTMIINPELHNGSFLPDGRFLVATNKGVLGIYPQFKQANPHCYFERIELFLNEINPDLKTSFDYQENNLGIHFNAVHFSSPDKVLFQYQLQGLHTNWIATSDHYVNFPKLPPGNYEFKLRASINKNFQFSPIASYRFSIARPIYLRWWFILVCSSLFVAVTWRIIRYRDQQKEAFRKMQQAELQSQLMALKTQVSPHFFFNNLNTLTTLIEEDPQLAVQYTTHLSDFFRNIIKHRDEHTIPLADEMSLVNDYLFLQKQRLGDALQIDNQISKTDLDRHEIPPLTLQMLLENAIKHNAISQQQPMTIQLSISGNELKIINNLIPRNQPVPGEKMGLKNIDERLYLLTGKKPAFQKTTSQFIAIIPLLKTTK